MEPPIFCFEPVRLHEPHEPCWAVIWKVQNFPDDEFIVRFKVILLRNIWIYSKNSKISYLKRKPFESTALTHLSKNFWNSLTSFLWTAPKEQTSAKDRLVSWIQGSSIYLFVRYRGLIFQDHRSQWLHYTVINEYIHSTTRNHSTSKIINTNNCSLCWVLEKI